MQATIAQPNYAYGASMPMFAGGGLAAAARELQSKGRGKDTMLVHMTPNEVKGLQALAMAHGGTLTINPDTGLPEADFLDAILPIVAGFALGPAGFALMSAPMAALTVGGVTAAMTGDLGQGLMAGLGAFGGANIGAALSSTGTEAAKLSMLPEGGMSVAESIPASMGGTGASTGSTLADIAGKTSTASGPMSMAPWAQPSVASQLGVNAAAPVAMTPTQVAALQSTAPTGFGSVGAGVKDLFSTGGIDRFGTALSQQAGGGLGATASLAGVGMPIVNALQPTYEFPSVEEATSNYAGPYRPAERKVQYPTYRDPKDSSEFLYFTPTNPYPGVVSAASGGAIGYAEGGQTETNYGFQPMNAAVAPVPAPTAGLTAIMPGSTIPAPTGDRALRMPGAGYTPGQAPEFNYNFKPIEVRKPIPPTPEVTSGPVARLFGKALFGGEPEGSIEDSGSEGAGLGGMFGRLLGKDKEEGYDNYTDLAQYKYDAATQSLVPAMASGGLTALARGSSVPLQDGSFIVDAKTVAEVGNGSSNAGLERLSRIGGKAIKGPGDGVSDSIKANIGGTQPARVARDEAYFSPEVVKRLGKGNPKKGADKLYALMEKAHKARKKTGRGEDSGLKGLLPA